jgi:hypothetical protein
LSALAFGLGDTSPINFDGVRAYEHVRHLVEIGPRPPASDGIHRAQVYITGHLKSYGCPVDQLRHHSLHNALRHRAHSEFRRR